MLVCIELPTQVKIFPKKLLRRKPYSMNTLLHTSRRYDLALKPL